MHQAVLICNAFGLVPPLTICVVLLHLLYRVPSSSKYRSTMNLCMSDGCRSRAFAFYMLRCSICNPEASPVFIGVINERVATELMKNMMESNQRECLRLGHALRRLRPDFRTSRIVCPCTLWIGTYPNSHRKTSHLVVSNVWSSPHPIFADASGLLFKEGFFGFKRGSSASSHPCFRKTFGHGIPCERPCGSGAQVRRHRVLVASSTEVRVSGATHKHPVG